MLELEKAIKISLDLTKQLDSQPVDLINAAGRYSSSNLISKVDLPEFDNSAMDGYALISSDLKQATKSNPITLNCSGVVPAGTIPNKKIKKGICMRIFTGSPIPDGANAVIMQEDCVHNNDMSIITSTSVKPWENIRMKGEDIRKGDNLISKGEQINIGAIALLNATGHKTVQVGRQPRVGLIATGSELIEPPKKLNSGEIYESNRTMLASMITQANGLPKIYPIVKDDLNKTIYALRSALSENDLVITTGGVSVGDHDHIKPALEQMSGTIVFWKISMKPGKPFMLGHANGKTLFALPGNPGSALTTFLLLVRPALLKLQGATCVHLIKRTGVLADEIINNGNRRHFVRVKLDEHSHATIAGKQRSHMLGSLPSSNGLIDIPPNSRLANGDKVEVLMIPS
jgi:molybdopterin molybdotransferase